MVKAFMLLALVMALSAETVAQSPAGFTPPHLVAGGSPDLPPVTVIGGGEVLVEGIVDRNGALTRPVLLRSTPPFSEMVLQALATWRFVPAHIVRSNAADEVVESTVLIAALYRPPTLVNGPTMGETPKDLAVASPDAPFAVTMVTPPYPPQALAGAVVMFEVSLDQIGAMKVVRAIRSDPGFDSGARDALLQWKFRGGAIQGREVPSTVYAIFGFSQPVIPPAR